VAINEQLQQEAQAVLDVIENPDVAQALRQDKNQNLTYLKDNYGVSDYVLYGLSILTPTTPSFFAAHP
jgi:translation initiation factor 3 subunit 6